MLMHMINYFNHAFNVLMHQFDRSTYVVFCRLRTKTRLICKMWPLLILSSNSYIHLSA